MNGTPRTVPWIPWKPWVPWMVNHGYLVPPDNYYFITMKVLHFDTVTVESSNWSNWMPKTWSLKPWTYMYQTIWIMILDWIGYRSAQEYSTTMSRPTLKWNQQPSHLARLDMFRSLGLKQQDSTKHSISWYQQVVAVPLQLNFTIHSKTKQKS